MSTLYDTYIELLPEDVQSGTGGTFTYGYNKHIAVAGFQKLITWWVKSFMTAQGSDLSNRDYGTTFSSLIGSNVTDRVDIQQIVHTAVAKATLDIRSVQAQYPPTDEQEILHSAQLTALIFEDNSAVSVYVLLQNQAGKRLQIILAGEVGA
jgi:phage baseplate assembly protein W